jgi:hypothetical protein
MVAELFLKLRVLLHLLITTALAIQAKVSWGGLQLTDHPLLCIKTGRFIHLLLPHLCMQSG